MQNHNDEDNIYYLDDRDDDNDKNESSLSKNNFLSIEDESESDDSFDSNEFRSTANLINSFFDEEAIMSWSDQISTFARSLVWAAFTDDSGDLHEIGKGLTFTIILGVILGLIVPPNFSLNTDWYPYLSNILGYTYFVAWSISWYPQIILNYNRKETDGLSVDLSILVVLGFLAYTVYTSAFFWSSSIKEIYSDHHNGEEVLVQSNDVAFCIHALIMSIFTLGQIGYYDGFRKRPPAKATVMFVLISLAITALYALLILVAHRGFFSWINFLYGLSYLKVIITFIKYFPQAFLNYSRKSTVGWNVWSVVLDFFGGLLSLLQLVLDCWNKNDFSGITGDIPKFFLSLLSMSFDVSSIIHLFHCPHLVLVTSKFYLNYFSI